MKEGARGSYCLVAKAGHWSVLWTGLVVAVLWLAGCQQDSRPDWWERLPSAPEVSAFPQQMQDELEQLEVSLRRESGRVAALGRLGMLYYANGFGDRAESVFGILGEIDANDHRWSYFLAYLYLRDGDKAAGVALLEKVVEAVPGYLPARLRLADALAKSGQIEWAKSAYRQCLKEDGRQAHALFGLARLLAAEGQEEEAEEQQRGVLLAGVLGELVQQGLIEKAHDEQEKEGGDIGARTDDELPELVAKQGQKVSHGSGRLWAEGASSFSGCGPGESAVELPAADGVASAAGSAPGVLASGS